MKDLEIWNKLKSVEVVSGELPQGKDEAVSSLWYVRVLQGIAGWLAALLLIGFLGFGVIGLFEHGPTLMSLGVIINVSAYVFVKSKSDSDFFEQLVLAFSLAGQFLFAFGLFEIFELSNRYWILIIGLYQLLLMWLVNHYLHRFLNACFAIMALFWSFDVLIYSGLGSALVAALFVWVWLDKTGWQAEREFYEPIGYALAFSLLSLNIQNHLWLSPFWFQQTEIGWLMQNAHWISAALNSMILLYFVYRMVQEYLVDLTSTAGKLIILTAVIMLFSALPVIGLSSSLLVLLVGFARRKVVLMIMGGLAMLGFVSWYYYSLHITLLQKSMILMAIGLVLLLGVALLKYGLSKNKKAGVEISLSDEKFSLSWRQKTAAALTLILGLGGVNHAILQKEQLLTDGQTVLLELAPVDPRSLMQGDYMRLRFAIAGQIRANLPSLSFVSEQGYYDGYVWVKLDESGVGQFHGLLNGEISFDQPELIDKLKQADSVIKMQYRIRNNRVQFATNAFFFQEGDAELFDAARYGQFKVADDGELLLTAMYDEGYTLLGKNRMD